MAKRMIYREGEEILRKKARPVTEFDAKLWTLLEDMKETMEHADGAGLAGPQIGILRQVVVIDVGDGPMELINPEILWTEGEQYELEGCLSCPGEWGKVRRPAKVRVKALDRFGESFQVEGTEMLARALCHEIDHLHGILFKDKAEEMVDISEGKGRSK